MRRAATAFATIIVVLALALSIGLFSGWFSAEDVSAPVLRASADNSGSTCGDAWPVPVAVPAGYGAAIAGPVPEAGAQESAQEVKHWTSANGSVEVRWPADEAIQGRLRVDAMSLSADDAPSSFRPTVVQEAAGGSPYLYEVFVLPSQAPPCHTFQVSVFGSRPAQLAQELDAIVRQGDTSAALVAETLPGAEAPAVTPCTPTEGTGSPNRGGPIADGPSHEMPEAALEGFISQDDTLIQRGYVAVPQSDGSIVYGVRSPGREIFVTVVHVSQFAEGWRVVSWEASGC